MATALQAALLKRKTKPGAKNHKASKKARLDDAGARNEAPGHATAAAKPAALAGDSEDDEEELLPTRGAYSALMGGLERAQHHQQRTQSDRKRRQGKRAVEPEPSSGAHAARVRHDSGASLRDLPAEGPQSARSDPEDAADADGPPSAALEASGSKQPIHDHYDAHLDRDLPADLQNALTHIRATPFVTAAPAPEGESWHGTRIATRHCEALPFLQSDAPTSLAAYGVKPRLQTRFQDVHASDVHASDTAAFATQRQASFFALCNAYHDVLHTAHPYATFPLQVHADTDAALLHATNHVLKKMDAVRRNNERLKAAAAVAATASKAAGTPRRRQSAAKAPASAASAAVESTTPVAASTSPVAAESETAEPAGDATVAGDEMNAEAVAAASTAPKPCGSADAGAANGSTRLDASVVETESAPTALGEWGLDVGLGPNLGASLEAAEGEVQDQGFVRPIVLLLAPTRCVAFAAVQRLLDYLQRERRSDSIQGRNRFVEEFGGGLEWEGGQGAWEASQEDGEGGGKPREHGALFAGDTDDHFKIGLKVTRGAVKLFADFYQSDVIVASPLALATHIDDTSGNGGADFLSSIEIALVLRADVMLMQNWAHVDAVLTSLNRVPTEQHGTDIMRVRPWALNEQGAMYRQTIMLSSFQAPELSAAFSACCNHAGQIKLSPAVVPGVLSRVIPQVRQLFRKFPATSYADSHERRFEFFTTAVWPRLKEASQPGLAIFASSYLEFVRLRNFLKAQGASLAVYCEYTPATDVARARGRFVRGERKILLYTERAHFYFRPRVRGIKDLVFYSLPLHAHYYAELLNLLDEATGAAAATHSTVQTLFSAYDALCLTRVVGQKRAKRMLKDASNSFLFT